MSVTILFWMVKISQVALKFNERKNELRILQKVNHCANKKVCGCDDIVQNGIEHILRGLFCIIGCD